MRTSLILYPALIVVGVLAASMIGECAREKPNAAVPDRDHVEVSVPSDTPMVLETTSDRGVVIEVVADEEVDPGSQAPADDEVAAMLAKIEQLALELEIEREVAASPYRAFLTSQDAEGTTQKQRDSVRYMLEEVPIYLQPYEAAWIWERDELDDWKLEAETREVAFITFLGPQRVLAEASPELLAQFRSWYDETEWLMLFGSPKPSK